ncbi:60S ribosomal protein L27a [Galemys pyrenaicus]|uniref:60S ribosomal protein L27a n=1 Tax=Galemys pyrenaicus TaxID=202257 RepID=A0A8J6DNH1_GALPY|nr:60S ribosomal protein L27a [Galemys pyrenaicus]
MPKAAPAHCISSTSGADLVGQELHQEGAVVTLVACGITGSTWTNITPVPLGKWCEEQSFRLTVSLDKQWTLVTEQTRVNAAKDQTGAAPIDVVRMSYYQVLGKGKVPSSL